MRNVLFIFLLMNLVSCGGDSEIVGNVAGPGAGVETGGEAPAILAEAVTINEVDPLNNLVEIINTTNETVDISSYWFCARDLSLSPGEIVLIETTMDLNDVDSDLGLYLTNTFGNPDAMVDFVQWGSNAFVGRESEAQTAGLWTVGDFLSLPAGINDSLNRSNPSESGIISWESAFKTFAGINAINADPARAVGGGRLVLSEVDPINNTIEIYNGTGAAVDLSTYWFCARRSYRQLNNSFNVVNGSLIIPDRGYVVLQSDTYDLNDSSSDLGLYTTNTFGDPNAMVDFVQWGGASGFVNRETEAVTAGLWNAGEFTAVPTAGSSIARLNSNQDMSGWLIESPSNGSGVERSL